MTKILFIGNFLSKKNGTLSVSEKISELLTTDFKIKITSNKSNKLLRILEIIYNSLIGKYDLIAIDVYSGWAFVIAEVSSFIAYLRGKKIILNLHGGRLPIFCKKNFNRVKSVLSKANYIQTPSKYLINNFQVFDIDINYLPNPINLNEFPYSRSHVEKNTVLWVRAFNDIYNPEIAIRIIKLLSKNFSDVKLTMIGPDKGSLKKIKKLIKDLKLKRNIKLLGPVSNKSLYKYYQTHEVFINTTSYESFGVSVVEAASCGIPIVSARVGEIPLIWENNKNILLVDLDEISFSEAISRIFKSQKLSNLLSLNARQRAENFDWSKIKPIWRNTFIKLLK